MSAWRCCATVSAAAGLLAEAVIAGLWYHAGLPAMLVELRTGLVLALAVCALGALGRHRALRAVTVRASCRQPALIRARPSPRRVAVKLPKSFP